MYNYDAPIDDVVNNLVANNIEEDKASKPVNVEEKSLDNVRELSNRFYSPLVKTIKVPLQLPMYIEIILRLNYSV